MALAPRVRPVIARLGLLLPTLVAFVLLSPPAPAVAQESAAPEPTSEPGTGPEAAEGGGSACAVTGYSLPPGEDLAALRERLLGEDARRLEGVDLTRDSDWVLPAGHRPVLVIDSTEPLGRVTLTGSVAGREFELWSGEAGRRFVSEVLPPHLGSTTRTMGLTITAESCVATIVVTVDRAVWFTRAGQVGVGLTALCGALLVVFARGRRGGWVRRFLLAAPFGLVAGVAQVAVLHETGRVDPFGGLPWWPPLVGLALAGLLPLTRPRLRPTQAPTGDPATELLPQVGAVVAGYRLEEPFGRNQFTGLFRATRLPQVPAQPGPAGPGGQPATAAGGRALVKVALPEWAGEPAARLRLEREAATLAGLEHPNVMRLREVVPGADAPVLVFEDVDGTSLRRLLSSGGGLSGPQVATVVLDLLDALSALHRRGLVHRDVRPDNILIDTEGRVRLANFEVACIGLEHPAAAEGTAPYASPEQLAGQVLDERSDLWACGVILAELLTGQVPAVPQLPELPAPLAGVLARALSVDPAGRPASAEQFAAELRDAAAREWGADWVGRGALAGVLVAHGVIGSMAAGYATAGTLGAGGAAALGTAGAAGGAGFGAAGAAPGAVAGLGAATPGGVTLAGTGVAASGSGAALVAKASAAVSVAAAAVVVAGTGLIAAVLDEEPAQAQVEVITPERARVILIDTVIDAQRGDLRHLAEEVGDQFEEMLEVDDALDETPPTGVVVGVPRGQYGYPAWFVGSAEFVYDGGMVSIFVRFERQEVGEPWRMTAFNWAVDEELPPPALTGDGWLAPTPAVADLVVDPQTLPDRYLDWLRRVEETGELGRDDVLTLRYDFGTLHEFAEDQIFDGDLDRVSFDYELTAGEVTTSPVPLANGTVHVTFTAVIHQVMYNTPDHRTASCDDYYLFWSNGQPPGRFRHIEHDFVVTLEAWVPVADVVASPRESVVIEDWKRRSVNREGTPC